MKSEKLRQLYLKFFEDKGHVIMPSSSLIPAADKTLLFTSAGMVQFKPYFTGEDIPPKSDLTSIQKCLRTTDIEEVGDLNHLTFFEMLGNFSIGGYFKQKAVELAWEFLVDVLKLESERLWVTIYTDDDEAFDVWIAKGVPKEKISRWGSKENYWGPVGNEGPCGPCSEIHYDYGIEYSCGKPDCGPNCCERFVELWNLVFMQFYQDSEGKKIPLPSPNIDTGMGLERAAAIMQNTTTVYDTDLFKGIIECIEGISGHTYGQHLESDIAIRVVAEHLRSATFMIADGVVPANDGRGYVLRRLIRRAITFGRKIDIHVSFVEEVARVVVGQMGEFYSELLQREIFVCKTLQAEEERFDHAINSGMPILEKAIIPLRTGLAGLDHLPDDKEIEDLMNSIHSMLQPKWFGDEIAADIRNAVGHKDKPRMNRLSGREIFVLYDTYGFPPELTEEVALQHGLGVDLESFQAELEKQKERARSAQKFVTDPSNKVYENLSEGSLFIGHNTYTCKSVLTSILLDGIPVDRINQTTESHQLEVVIKNTPFYAEGGGQIGDTGIIESDTGRLEVLDTFTPIIGVNVHKVTLVRGLLEVGQEITASINTERRRNTTRNHTATHMLHAALREVLGSHVQQAGSLVAEDRLRFDFTHVSPVQSKELQEIQELVNRRIRDNILVENVETTYKDALSKGALAFFGDKYGHKVNVVTIAGDTDFSVEMCGGTHLESTGQVGYFRIISESSVGSGLRRIEAVTGSFAEKVADDNLSLLNAVAASMGVGIKQIGARLEHLMKQLEESKRKENIETEHSHKDIVENLLQSATDIGDIRLLIGQVDCSSTDFLRIIADQLKSKATKSVIVLGTIIEDKPKILVMVDSLLISYGYSAKTIVQDLAAVIGGGGGGRPEMAQAGGTDPSKLEQALSRAIEMIQEIEAKR